MPFVILAIVATPFVFTGWLISRILEHRRRMHALPPVAQPEMLALRAARDELEQRIRVLEEIVCSQDYELDRRLRQVG